MVLNIVRWRFPIFEMGCEGLCDTRGEIRIEVTDIVIFFIFFIFGPQNKYMGEFEFV